MVAAVVLLLAAVYLLKVDMQWFSQN